MNSQSLMCSHFYPFIFAITTKEFMGFKNDGLSKFDGCYSNAAKLCLSDFN